MLVMWHLQILQNCGVLTVLGSVRDIGLTINWENNYLIDGQVPNLNKQTNESIICMGE